MVKLGQSLLQIPKWLTFLVILGLICMSLAVVTVFRDLEREKALLRELYLQKGEMLIRMLDLAHGFGWIQQFNSERLTTTRDEMSKRDDPDFGLMFMAVTRYDGTGIAASEPLDSFAPEDFANPEPVSVFHPNWVAFGRDMTLFNDRMVFVVYRPLLSSVMDRPAPKPHDPGAPHAGPPGEHKKREWPPDIDLATADARALYLWVGFDYRQFEIAARAGLVNALLLTGLIALMLAIGVLYFTRSTRHIRSLAMTDEILNRLPIGLLFSDQSGKLTIANPAALTIMGLDRESVLGRSIEEITDGDFPSDREITSLERDVRFTGGRTPRLAISAGPVVAPKAGEIGRVVLLADLAVIDRLKEEVAKNSRLARLVGLASGLANNIRNPVGSIKALAQHLMDQGPPPQEREPLSIILGGVDRLNRTLDDFLDFAFPEVKYELVDIMRALRDVHDLNVARVATTGSRASLELKTPDGPMYFLGDEERLKTALDCLYQNAVEAVDSRRQSSRVAVTADRAGAAKCVIRFQDDGPGFRPSQLQTPFVPYFTTKPDRIGLGLAKANNIIEAFKGTVALANVPGGGALATVTLPLSSDGLSKLKSEAVDLTQLLTRVHNRAKQFPGTRNVDLLLERPETPVIIEADKIRLEDALVKAYLAGAAASADNPPDQPRTLTTTLTTTASGGAEITLAYNAPSRAAAASFPALDPILSGPDSVKAAIEAHGGQLSLEAASGGGLFHLTLPKGRPVSLSKS